MDVLDVMVPVWNFLARYFGITLTVGGFSFSVGALVLWSLLIVFFISFLKGLAS